MATFTDKKNLDPISSLAAYDENNLFYLDLHTLAFNETAQGRVSVATNRPVN